MLNDDVDERTKLNYAFLLLRTIFLTLRPVVIILMILLTILFSITYAHTFFSVFKGYIMPFSASCFVIICHWQWAFKKIKLLQKLVQHSKWISNVNFSTLPLLQPHKNTFCVKNYCNIALISVFLLEWNRRAWCNIARQLSGKPEWSILG